MDQRSSHRRSSSAPSARSVPPYRNKRVLALLAAVVTVAGIVTVTQVANAGTRRHRPVTMPCPPTATASNGGTAQQNGTAKQNGGVQNGRQVWNYPDDQGDANNGVQNSRWSGNRPRCRPTATPTATATDPGNGGGGTTGPVESGSASATGGASSSAGATATASSSSSTDPGKVGNLGTDCKNSDLPAHTGFQDGERCVSVAHGEVPALAKAPTLLITKFPSQVGVNQPFEIEVSTRNLVRDRFLAAATGGYYAESSFLTADGLVRGHLHTSCRLLASTTEAPDPAPVPAFFVATEDGGGGAKPDTLKIAVTGLPTAGTFQCSIWAGDGGHRTPMMQTAKQQPAFDSVRVTVGAATARR